MIIMHKQMQFNLKLLNKMFVLAKGKTNRKNDQEKCLLLSDTTYELLLC